MIYNFFLISLYFLGKLDLVNSILVNFIFILLLIIIDSVVIICFLRFCSIIKLFYLSIS